MYKQWVILLSSCIIVACAGTDEVDSVAAAGANSGQSDCISQGSIRDYKVLDEANLLVTERASRKYHVQLSRRAYGLRASRAIGFETATSRVCAPFDDLLFEGSFGAESVSIASIRRLTPEQEEELLVRFGIIEPAVEQPRAPEPVQGAEVEELD